MAKKKSTTKVATKTDTSTKKKVTKRVSAAKKPTAKKGTAQKGRKSAGQKVSKTAAKKDSHSVDGILKKFVQERSSLDSHLAALDKKIIDLEAKTKLYKEQLVALSQDKEATLGSISQIDSRRDLEVSEVLAKLGVKVTEVVPPATTSVVFDVKPAEAGANGQVRNESEELFAHEDE